MKKFIRCIAKNSIFITCLLLAASTLLSFILFHIVPENTANVALIYILALILISRYTPGYYYGIFSAVFCVIAVNFFFTYPYFKLNFTLTGYPITFIGMLAISLLTSTTTTHIIEQSQALAEKEKQLMEADKEKMRANLLRAVSHDLRTPLTSIMGAISSYLEDSSSMTDADRQELAHHIYDDSNWLLNMVENLLSVTRIQNDSTKVKKSHELVEEVVSESVTRLKKRIPEAEIVVKIPDDFLMIPMDAMLIEQVLINLLENSIIHSQSERATELLVNADSNFVYFHVIDYGVGIDNANLEFIFDGIPLSASPSSDSRKGMGIGLSICKTIILAHNGTICAKNHEHGAEFVFTLPQT